MSFTTRQNYELAVAPQASHIKHSETLIHSHLQLTSSMADEFSFLTDSDDERAVEDVLSQAMDHSVLEQIAAINCSSFSDNLPSHLENRFRKLKSLPTATSAAASRFPPSKSKSFTPQSGVVSSLNDRHHKSTNSVDFQQIPDLKNCSKKPPPFTGDLEEDEREHSGDSEQIPDLKCSRKPFPSTGDPEEHERSSDFEQIRYEKKSSNSRSKPKPKPEQQTPDLKKCSRKPSPSTGDLEEHDHSSDFEQIRDKKKSSNSRSKPKRRTGSSESQSDSWSVSSESRSVSPVRRSIGCLWCSPKKEKRKQGKENRSTTSYWGNDNDDDDDDDGEFMKMFSVREQKKIMKKAMKEEEKINREAEKIVKWAKQASGRMMMDDVEDELDDHSFGK